MQLKAAIAFPRHYTREWIRALTSGVARVTCGAGTIQRKAEDQDGGGDVDGNGGGESGCKRDSSSNYGYGSHGTSSSSPLGLGFRVKEMLLGYERMNATATANPSGSPMP